MQFCVSDLTQAPIQPDNCRVFLANLSSPPVSHGAELYPAMHTSASIRSQGRRVPAATLAAPALPIALTGESAPVRRARAALDLPGAGALLVLAEDGLDALSVARYVHERTRVGQPFVRVDCAE